MVPLLDIPADGLLRCTRSVEALYVGEDGLIRCNLHAHTTCSDGIRTVDEVAALAAHARTNIAITDHNRAPRVDGPWPAGLIAGMEVFCKEDVEIVVLGTLAEMQAIDDELVRPNLGKISSQFLPTTLSIRDLLARSRFHIFPHYASTEGLSWLPADVQAELLVLDGGRGMLEFNAVMPQWHQALTAQVAETWDIALVRTGDTHAGDRLYVETGSDVPLHELTDSDAPLVERVLAAYRDRREVVSHRLASPTKRELLAAAVQIARKNGARPMLTYLRKNVQRAMGQAPRARPSNLPTKR